MASQDSNTFSATNFPHYVIPPQQEQQQQQQQPQYYPQQVQPHQVAYFHPYYPQQHQPHPYPVAPYAAPTQQHYQQAGQYGAPVNATPWAYPQQQQQQPYSQQVEQPEQANAIEEIPVAPCRSKGHAGFQLLLILQLALSLYYVFVSNNILAWSFSGLYIFALIGVKLRSAFMLIIFTLFNLLGVYITTVLLIDQFNQYAQYGDATGTVIFLFICALQWASTVACIRSIKRINRQGT